MQVVRVAVDVVQEVIEVKVDVVVVVFFIRVNVVNDIEAVLNRNLSCWFLDVSVEEEQSKETTKINKQAMSKRILQYFGLHKVFYFFQKEKVQNLIIKLE